MSPSRAAAFRKGSVVFTGALAALVLAMVVAAQGYPRDVGIVPTVVGVPTLLLLLLDLARQVFPERLQRVAVPGVAASARLHLDQGVEEDLQTDAAPWPNVLRVGGMLLFLGLASYWLGFVFSTGIFVFTAFIVWARVRWFMALGVGLLSAGAVHLLFRELLRFNIWIGALPEIIPGWLGGQIAPPFL